MVVGRRDVAEELSVTFALHNATVINPGAGSLEAQTITIDGERISDVTSQAGSGEHADQTLDVGGAFVMPGLTLSHTHTQLGLGGFEMFGEKYPGTERPPGVLMAVAIRTCQTLLDSGITGYVGAACSHDIDASLKIAIADGIIDGPRILACGRQVNTTANDNDTCGAKWWYEAVNLGIERFADGVDGMVKAVRDESPR
jgi:imidazolonepropionase-like amidohydrolase